MAEIRWPRTDLYGRQKEGEGSWHVLNVGRITVLSLVILALLLALTLVSLFAFKANSRYQKRADATNNVKVTNTLIRNSAQRVKVQQQEAKVRYAEAVGIRRAQDEISRTLTDRYLQHEAIQAQMKMASSKNHTQVYVPSGQNGIPIVQTAPRPGGEGN